MDKHQTTASTPPLLGSHRLPWFVLLALAAGLLLLTTFAYWRSSSVGPQVQVPMFYDAHYLFPRPWTQAQSAPGVPDPAPVALYGDYVVSQSFVAGSDNLARVAFFLSGPEDGRVSAILTDEHGNSWAAEIALSPASDGEEYSITIPPQTESKGQRFTLTLASPRTTVDSPLIVTSVGGDRLGDSLRLNEFIRPGNLAITTYSRGTPGFWWLDSIAEQLLPGLFRQRIQQYKPPQFKGALFSWLLLITAGLSAVLLVLATPRRQIQEQSLSRELVRSLGWFLVILLGAFMIWQVGSGRAKLFADSNQAAAESAPPAAAAHAKSDPRVVVDLTNDLWTADREPEARFVSTGIIQGYPAIRVPADSRIQYALAVPPDSRLRIARAAEGAGTIEFGVKVNDETLFEGVVKAAGQSFPEDLAWRELDLSPWAGQGVVLSLETSLQDGQAQGLWLMPQVITDASWVLPDTPADLEYLPIGVRFEDTAELLGVVLHSDAQQAANRLAVQLLWRPLQATERYGKVFVHLIDGSGQLVAQHDGAPVNNAYPTAVWQPGTIVRDEHILQLDGDLAAGPYRLEIGIYDPDSLQRWTAESADGSAIEQGRAALALPTEVLP